MAKTTITFRKGRQLLRHRNRLVELLAELEREHGPISEQVSREVQEAWPEAEGNAPPLQC